MTVNFIAIKKTVWFGRLLEKVIASHILSNKFNLEWLEEYDDNELERLICQNRDRDNRHTGLPGRWCDRAEKILNNEFIFERIFKLGNNSSPLLYSGDIVDLEYHLLDKQPSTRGLLEYPFEQGILLAIDHADPEYDADDQLSGYSLSLFHNPSSDSLDPIAKTISRVVPKLGFSSVSEVRKGIARILSPTGHIRFDNNLGLSENVVESISLAVDSLDQKYVDSFFASLRKYSSFEHLKYPLENTLWLNTNGSVLASRGHGPEGDQNQYGLASGLLSLPITLLQYREPSKFLGRVEDQLKDMFINDSNVQDGYIFESLCLIDRMLNSYDGFQFFINGVEIIDPSVEKRKRKVSEYDITELRYNDERGSSLHLYECTTEDDPVSKDRDDLRDFADHIRDDKFSDVTIHTHHMNNEEGDGCSIEIRDDVVLNMP